MFGLLTSGHKHTRARTQRSWLNNCVLGLLDDNDEDLLSVQLHCLQ